MALDDRTAFKAGFLLRCAEAGLTADETAQAMEKAAGIFDNEIGAALALGVGGLGAAGAAGALGGSVLAHMNQHHVDPDEVKKQELIAAYNTFADQLRHRQKLAPRGQIRVPVRMQ